MTTLQAFQRLLGREFLDEEGEPYEFTAYPPCSEEQIAQFAAELPCPLPEAMRELLRFSRGFEGGPVEWVNFMAEETWGGQMLYHPISLQGDGFGNSWMVDLTPDSKTWGPIYFWSHDPPVLVYQCADLTEFLLQLGQMAESPGENPIDEVWQDAVNTIWQDNPGLIPQPIAAASSDEELKTFAERFPSDWLFCDLRNPQRGEGFSWGRRDIGETAAHDTKPIYAYRLADGGEG